MLDVHILPKLACPDRRINLTRGVFRGAARGVESNSYESGFMQWALRFIVGAGCISDGRERFYVRLNAVCSLDSRRPIIQKVRRPPPPVFTGCPSNAVVLRGDRASGRKAFRRKVWKVDRGQHSAVTFSPCPSKPCFCHSVEIAFIFGCDRIFAASHSVQCSKPMIGLSFEFI